MRPRRTHKKCRPSCRQTKNYYLCITKERSFGRTFYKVRPHPYAMQKSKNDFRFLFGTFTLPYSAIKSNGFKTKNSGSTSPGAARHPPRQRGGQGSSSRQHALRRNTRPPRPLVPSFLNPLSPLAFLLLALLPSFNQVISCLNSTFVSISKASLPRSNASTGGWTRFRPTSWSRTNRAGAGRSASPCPPL